MKRILVRGIHWIGFIGLFYSLACTPPFYKPGNTADTSAKAAADSILYIITVDSISIPVHLQEMGDFPAYQADAPHRFTLPTNVVNYRDTAYLHFLNGQLLEGKKKSRVLRRLKAADIQSIELMPAEQATELYGPKAANGVIFIETRHRKYK